MARHEDGAQTFGHAPVYNAHVRLAFEGGITALHGGRRPNEAAKAVSELTGGGTRARRVSLCSAAAS
jgi:hypothetical protein